MTMKQQIELIKMTRPVIEINNLEKSFSGFKALKGINLQIKKGR